MKNGIQTLFDGFLCTNQRVRQRLDSVVLEVHKVTNLQHNFSAHLACSVSV